MPAVNPTHTRLPAVILVLLCAAPLRAETDKHVPLAEKVVLGQAACEQGNALAEQGRDGIALLFLERCHRFFLSKEIRTKMHEVRKRSRTSMSETAPVSLALTPETARARLVGSEHAPPYSGQQLLNEDELWLAQGNYELAVVADGYQEARVGFVVESSDRMLIPITLKALPRPAETHIDMSDTGGAELGQVTSIADPRPKKFATLLAKRYQRAPTPTPLPHLQVQDERSRGAWPYLVAGLGLVSVGTGTVLQLRGRRHPAIAAHTGGAVFGSVATYLFLRKQDGTQQSVAFGIGSGGAVFLLSGPL